MQRHLESDGQCKRCHANAGSAPGPGSPAAQEVPDEEDECGVRQGMACASRASLARVPVWFWRPQALDPGAYREMEVKCRVPDLRTLIAKQAGQFTFGCFRA